MSAVPTDIKPMPAAKRFNEVTVNGKIEDYRRYEKKHFHLVLTPSPDKYSRPQLIEIRSDLKLGQPGEEITVDCVLSGYRKDWNLTDKGSGEITKIKSAVMALDAI